MSAAGDRYRKLVKRLPCCVCVLFFGMSTEPWPEPTASDAHHPRTGAGAGRKNADEECIALCKEHHQGSTGVHGLGRKAFERKWGVTEAELTAMTQRRVQAMTGRVACPT